MDKKNLLTIKQFGRICGITPTSLRYYDSLGILKPAYTDPDTGYRYYAILQREEVYAIQYCLEAGISLKELPAYENISTSMIRYPQLYAHGLQVLRERIRTLEHIIARWTPISNEIAHGQEVAASSGTVPYLYGGSWCLILPCERPDYYRNWQDDFLFLWELAAQAHLAISHDGVICLRQDGQWRRFYFLTLLDDPRGKVEEQYLLRIPVGQWICRKAPSYRLEDAQDWIASLAPAQEVEMVMVTELLTEDYNYSDPSMEYRLLLKENIHSEP